MKPRIFQEQQRFTQWWLWLIIAMVILIPLYKPFMTLLNGGALVGSPLDVGFWIGFVVAIGVVLLFRFLKLETAIDEHGISLQFHPFQKQPRRISWSELQSVRTRKYNPILEYGGWGFKSGISGGAYNVKGNRGIQLQLKSGKKLLIGTQKPKEAQEIIDKYFKS